MNVIAQENDTVDAICWRYYRRTQGMTEWVVEINPGLADCGAFLPHGVEIVLPDWAPAVHHPSLTLWD